MSLPSQSVFHVSSSFTRSDSVYSMLRYSLGFASYKLCVLRFHLCLHPLIPRVPLPVLRCYLFQRDMFYLLESRYLSSSLLRAHASVHIPPLVFAFWLYNRSLQVVAIPCWDMDFPDVISVLLLVSARSPIPVVSELLLTVSSLRSLPFPQKSMGRVNHNNVLLKQLLEGAISGPQIFSYVRALTFACHPGCPYSSGFCL